MKTGKKLRGFFSLILVFSLVMGLIVSPIRQEYAGAAGPFPGLFRVAMVRGPGLDTNVEMLDIQRQSSRHSKNVNLNFKGSFSLYKVPKDVILYEDAKEYFTEENRLYCIEALGHQEFINPNPDFLEDDIKARPDDYHDIFEENPQVAEKLKDMFGTRAKDWERAGRGMIYSNLMGMQAEFAQYIFYFASKQAKHSDWIKYPKEAGYKTTQIDKDNLESVSLYNGNKEAVRILVESELMKLRADVRAENMEKIVKAPGSYAFDPIEGYAISGMTAESQNPEIKIDERFTKPLSREDMKKSDEAYRLEFEIGENLPNGTYKIQVKRMDLRGKPEWTYYSSYNYDLENSGQFLGSYNMDVGEIVDEFVIKYENPNLPPAPAQVDENT